MRKAFHISIMVGFACLFLLRSGDSAMASEPSREPILRIETGIHTAMINRIGVDASGKCFVTASDDRTVRVWELPSGRLKRIIRPPVGEGEEGKLYAVAISPDGRTLACGGWTKLGSDTGHTIYFFDVNTGRLVRQITGLPNVINDLAFSRDGGLLAAVLGKGMGLRVFRTSDGQETASDINYGNRSYSVDFDARGRLVTTCYDGYIRLYDQNFSLIAKKKVPGGKRPFLARFSPDGDQIATGFADSTNVALLSGRDLSFLYWPDTSGVDYGNLSKVAWSVDGKSLYAAGRWMEHEQCPIRCWSLTGWRSYKDLRVGPMNTIMDLAPLPDGSIAFASADPAFGVVSSSGDVSIFSGPAIADHRADQEGFLISSDGGTVQFSYDFQGESTGRFTVSGRLLETDADASASLASPLTTAPDLTITDWYNKTSPRLNGNSLKLDQNEISRSLAIARDGEGFLLGTEWHLRAYNRSGSERWHVPVPDTAWGVNISGDGKVAAAAFDDGTIRWYRMTDGKELLAFFPHNDRKRWVMWTPGGFYDASPGAEELIGWHLNRGKGQAADFFPVSRFRSTCYRPDVIAKILETLDEKEALRLADEESGCKSRKQAIKMMLPPVVTILSPADGSNFSRQKVTVSCSLRSPSGEPVTAVRVLVDGRPASTQGGISIKTKGESTQQIQVILPKRDAEVSLIAENRYAVSVPSTIRLHWQGKAESFVKPKLYVLAIGVSEYKDSDRTPGFSAKDARDFAASMKGQKGGPYRDVTVRILTDRQATKDHIMDDLNRIRKETTSKDIAMVFLAGQGTNDQTGICYYLPADADTKMLERTGVSFSDIKNSLASLAGRAVLFLDMCHSGNAAGTRRGGPDVNVIANELAGAENGVVVFASSTGRQYSLEDKSWGNGAFTKALVEGISGKADDQGKGMITLDMLDLYLSERVKELTGGKQTPTMTKPHSIPDFPVAMKR